jgi:hypothetical protein
VEAVAWYLPPCYGLQIDLGSSSVRVDEKSKNFSLLVFPQALVPDQNERQLCGR